MIRKVTAIKLFLALNPVQLTKNLGLFDFVIDEKIKKANNSIVKKR